MHPLDEHKGENGDMHHRGKRMIQEHAFTHIALAFGPWRPCVAEIWKDHVDGGGTQVDVLPESAKLMQYGRTEWNRNMDMRNDRGWE